jgi:hypothetical protein
MAMRADSDVRATKFPAQHPPPESDSCTTPQFAGKQIQTVCLNESSRQYQRIIVCDSLIHDLTSGHPSIASTLLMVLLIISQRHPTPDHSAILPVEDAASSDAHSGVRALDDVGGRQAAMQHSQPVDSEAFLQPSR